MKKYILLPALLIVFILNNTTVGAKSATAAAELTYEWISDSTYRFVYKLYNDCSGGAAPDSIGMCIKNRCDVFNTTLTLNKIKGVLPNGNPNGADVFWDPCNKKTSTCTNPSSVIPGYRQWWYSATFTLPSRCIKWEFSVTVNSRNISDNLVNNNVNLWTGATLNNLDFQGDTSPYFSVSPVVFISTNTPYTYNNGVVDINQDSLEVRMIYPSSGLSCGDTIDKPADRIGFSSVDYNLYDNPFATNHTFTLNKRNWQMDFMASKDQKAAVSLLCTTYRNGVEVGEVMRNIQLISITDTFFYPVLTFKLLNGFVEKDSSVTASVGQLFSFNMVGSSGYKDAKLYIDDNHLATCKGCSMIYTNAGTPKVSGLFTWVPAITDTGLHVMSFQVWDSTCRNYGWMITEQPNYLLPVYVSPWPAGVKNVNAQGLDISPNPATRVVNIQLPHHANGLATIYVTDVTGRMVMQTIADVSKATNLNLCTFQNGLYFIRIKIGETTYMGKVLLNK